MKIFFTLCCVFVTLAAAVCAQDAARGTAQTPAPAPTPVKHGGKIETAYDGFAHETIISLKQMVVTCDGVRGVKGAFKKLCVSFRVALHCPGRQLEYVRRATVTLTFESKDWDARHPLNERQLTAVADGETLRLGRMELVSQGVGENWMDEKSKETLQLSIPYDTFLKLARANRVEFSVGKTAFALHDKNVAALRDMNDRIKTPQTTAGGGN
ncbi:MAG TPA: hypothetical protein VF297_08915 [Pyrinomonadaceae bacterium]